MTPEEFRKLALSFPEAVEASHFDHPDFRVRGKIFATLGYPDDDHAVLALTPGEQANAIQRDRATFSPAAGAWGRRGSTCVLLPACEKEVVKSLMKTAWYKVAPRVLRNASDESAEEGLRGGQTNFPER